MNRKIKIPKKGDFGIYIILGTLSFIISLAYAFLIIKEFPERAIKPLSLYFILGTIIPGPIIWILCYYNLYKYYSPKFRTIEARSLMDMLALGEGEVYEVLNEHPVRSNLFLRKKDFYSKEYFYVRLQIPESEVSFTDFAKRVESFKSPNSKYALKIKGISFHKIEREVEGKTESHIEYKFWALKSEKEILYQPQVAT